MKPITKYIRDINHRPIATIVALDADHIGVSVCNPGDVFRKKDGRFYATRKARTKEPTVIPQREITVGYREATMGPITYYEMECAMLSDLVEDTVEHLKLRCLKQGLKYVANAQEVTSG